MGVWQWTSQLELPKANLLGFWSMTPVDSTDVKTDGNIHCMQQSLFICLQIRKEAEELLPLRWSH